MRRPYPDPDRSRMKRREGKDRGSQRGRRFSFEKRECQKGVKKKSVAKLRALISTSTEIPTEIDSGKRKDRGATQNLGEQE